MRHHLRQPHFKEGVIEATQEFFVAQPWRGTAYEKTEKFNVWARKVSHLYDIIPPVIMVAQEPEFSVLSDSAPPNVLVLPKHSVLTLFHYYRHYMQYVADIPESLHGPEAIEIDAVDWSCSLFYQANPNQFEKSVRNGKIRYVTPEDLVPLDDVLGPKLTEVQQAAFDELTDRFLEDLDDDSDAEFMDIMEQWAAPNDDDS